MELCVIYLFIYDTSICGSVNEDKSYRIIPLIDIAVLESVMINDVSLLCKTPGLHYIHTNMDCMRKLVKSLIFENSFKS